MSKHNRERRKQNRQLPKHVGPVIASAQGLKPGFYMVNVRHDDNCNLLKGKGPCNCNPEVRPPERVPSPEDN